MKDNVKCFILAAAGYEEITYAALKQRVESDPDYKTKKFIPLHGTLMEVPEEDYREFYRVRRRQKYLLEEAIRAGEVSVDALDDDETNGADLIEDPSPQPEDVVADRMMLESMRRCLKLLDEKSRELIQAVFYDGKSERTLAKELGLTQPAVHYRIAQALAKLKVFMER